LKGSKVQGFKGSGFRGSEVQGFRGSGVQRFRGSKVQGSGVRGSEVQRFRVQVSGKVDAIAYPEHLYETSSGYGKIKVGPTPLARHTQGV
jgi:hypothetical protein